MKFIKRLTVRCLSLCALLCAAGLFLLSACETPVNDPGPDAGGPTTFTATIEGGDGTKTTLGALSSGTRPVYWSNDDAISISGATYTVSSGTGTATATFTGSGASQTGGKYKAYYPTSIYNSGSPSLPASQDYSATRIDNLPMYAESESTTLEFKNLCAVLNLRLRGTGTVTSIEVQSDEHSLNGPFQVERRETSGWYASLQSGGTNTVTLNCSSGVVLSESSPSDFFIALPAGTYAQGKLKVTVRGTGGVLPVEFINKSSSTSLTASYIYGLETPAPGLEAVLSGGDLILWSTEIGVATWDGVLWNAQRLIVRELERIQWD